MTTWASRLGAHAPQKLGELARTDVANAETHMQVNDSVMSLYAI